MLNETDANYNAKLICYERIQTSDWNITADSEESVSVIEKHLNSNDILRENICRTSVTMSLYHSSLPHLQAIYQKIGQCLQALIGEPPMFKLMGGRYHLWDGSSFTLILSYIVAD